MSNTTLFDMGGLYLLFIYSLVYGIIAFIATVVLEAVIMKKFYAFPFSKRMGYTLIMNLISITLGIPLVSSLGSHDIAPVDFSLFAFWAHFMLPVKWIMLSFVMTVLIEFICLVIILKVFEHIRLISPRIMQEAAHESARSDFWPPSKINNPLIEFFKFSITPNLASYVLTFTASYVVALFLFVIKG